MFRNLVTAGLLGGMSVTSAWAAPRTSFECEIKRVSSQLDEQIRRLKFDVDRLDKKTPAHIHTWFALLGLEQIDEVFGEAGKLKVSRLAIWNENKLGSKSRHLAVQLDRFFVNLLHAKGVEGAVVRLAAALEEGGGRGLSLRWLADRVDELYQFANESNAGT